MRGEVLKLCCILIFCVFPGRPASSSEAIALFSQTLSYMGLNFPGAVWRGLTMALLLGMRDRTF